MSQQLAWNQVSRLLCSRAFHSMTCFPESLFPHMWVPRLYPSSSAAPAGPSVSTSRVSSILSFQLSKAQTCPSTLDGMGRSL